MADIELVIKISEENYNIIKNYKAPMSWAEHVIKNGTPLPKGHGRLIDVDRLYDFVCEKYSEGEQLAIDISDAPTIIEAEEVTE